MAERPLIRVLSGLRTTAALLALLLAGLTAVAVWLLHAPGPVALLAAAAVLAVNVGAGLLLGRNRPEVAPAGPPHRPLTRREWEVSELLTEGLTNKEIGARLYIGEASVDTHLAHVREKLGVHTRAEIARWVTERRRRG